MDPEAFGKWLSGEIGVAAHVSFWVAVSVAAFLIWRAMEWRYAGMIERLRDERDSLLRREHHTHAELRVQEQIGAPSPPALSAVAHSPTPPSHRVFVGKGVTPESLMRMLDGTTYAQAKTLPEPFTGKWIRAKVVVKDVYPTADFEHVWGKTEDGSGQLTLRFAEPEWPRVEALTIEETVTFIGSIKELSQHEVVLVECEFADDAS